LDPKSTVLILQSKLLPQMSTLAIHLCLIKTMITTTENLSPSTQNSLIARWRFWIPVALQLLIIALVPAPKAYTLATGKTVFLQTIPVDPYDILRGRYVTLNYEIANWETLEKLPGWEPEFERERSEFYLILEGSSTSSTDPWQVVAVSKVYPKNLDPDQIVLKASGGSWPGASLGIDQYYIPEDIGDRLEVDIRAHQAKTRVEAKIDSFGHAAIVGVWVEDRSY
jgi:uncharacterized membrane-anchored protein